ncbi:MAG: hypothetical protein M1837_004096 [Sclerophora amabilis]|nr:MAG: hypothetical protein M1837_004096 [Sclerophora amabilis]
MSSRRTKGGPRSQNKATQSREVTVSKMLSFLLRHGAQKEGIQLDEQGYANVADILSWPKIRNQKVTLSELRSLVADNDKQRYTLIRRPLFTTPTTTTTSSSADSSSAMDDLSNDPSSYLIRASQGHSVQIDSSLLLSPITPTTDPFPTVAIHGTTRAAWTKILATGGLSKMRRTHIHFAPGLTPPSSRQDSSSNPPPAPKVDSEILSLPSPPSSSSPTRPETLSTTQPTAFTTNQQPPASPLPSATPTEPVISGLRASADILIYVSIARSLDAGLAWWRSDNGVLLTEGDGAGKLGTEFFEKVVAGRKDNGKVIWKRGEGELPLIDGKGVGVGGGGDDDAGPRKSAPSKKEPDDEVAREEDLLLDKLAIDRR